MAAPFPRHSTVIIIILTSGLAEVLDILRKTFSAQFGRRLKWSQLAVPIEPLILTNCPGATSPWHHCFHFIDQWSPLTHLVGSGLVHTSVQDSSLLFKKILPLSTNVNIINYSQGTMCWLLRKCTGLDNASVVLAPCSCVTSGKALPLSEPSVLSLGDF